MLLFFKPERRSTKKYCSNVDLVLESCILQEKIKVSVVNKNICESLSKKNLFPSENVKKG